jgi:hypothetical protein
METVVTLTPTHVPPARKGALSHILEMMFVEMKWIRWDALPPVFLGGNYETLLKPRGDD